MSNRVTVRLDRFGREALDDYVRGSGGSRPAALRAALHYYLADYESGRVAWRVPRQTEVGDAGEPLELELGNELRGALEMESRRQEVTPEVLVVHALMYFLADLDSGQAAARLGDAMKRDAEAK